MIRTTQHHRSRPRCPRGAAKPSLLPAVVAVFVVLVGVIYFSKSKGERELASPQPVNRRSEGALSADAGRTDKAAEQAAVKKLRERKIIVIEERSDPDAPQEKQVTSINFCGATNFVGQPVPDELLVPLRHFPDLQCLNVGDCRLTGKQLKYLAGLNRLASLVLSNTAVDDDGLEKISLLESIESLNLRDTAISDAGLDHIAELRNLKVLDLSKTRVTDAGINKLKPLAGLKWLLLSKTTLSDAGLDQLVSLKALGRLTVSETDVTKEGIEKIKRAIPGLKVDCDPPTPTP